VDSLWKISFLSLFIVLMGCATPINREAATKRIVAGESLATESISLVCGAYMVIAPAGQKTGGGVHGTAAITKDTFLFYKGKPDRSDFAQILKLPLSEAKGVGLHRLGLGVQTQIRASLGTVGFTCDRGELVDKKATIEAFELLKVAGLPMFTTEYLLYEARGGVIPIFIN